MARESLAVKYRPSRFSEVVEQDTIKQILLQELAKGEVKRVLLFTGPAGCGKTTNGRIFAREVESQTANIIELNAADHTGVEDMRAIIEQAKSKPITGNKKVFILDEVHCLTTNAQNSLLKLLEEPPAHCLFILCTTDPQKILSTILSRAFRYDFQLISHKGIVDRLNYILTQEKQQQGELKVNAWDTDALSYIAKVSRGHMRDAITTLDKVLSYSSDITVDTVVKVLGITGYDIMFEVLDSILEKNQAKLIDSIDQVYKSGKDLKLFLKNFLSFTLDINKYVLLKQFDYIDIPSTYENRLVRYNQGYRPALKHLLDTLIDLNSNVKWETDPRTLIESTLLLEVL